jgi:hypothetical protein
MDSEAKPIPECLQHLREFPSFVYQAAGAALLPGKISAVLFCFLKIHTFPDGAPHICGGFQSIRIKIKAHTSSLSTLLPIYL